MIKISKEFRDAINIPRMKKSRNVALIIFFCACFIALGERIAQAEGNIHISKLRIHPFVSVSVTESDNIYSTPTASASESDTITTYSPGVKLQLPFGKHQAEAQYYATINRYKVQSGEDTENSTAAGTIDFSAGNPFGLKLSDTFVKGHESRGSSATGFIEKFRSNAATISTFFHLGSRSKIQIDHGRVWWDYETSTFRNRDESLSSGFFYYRVLPKTSTFVEVGSKKVTYENSLMDLDSTSLNGLLGFTWEITEKSQSTIKGGLERKEFESQSHRAFRGSVGVIDLHHEFSEYTTVTLIGRRAVNETSLVGSRYILTTGAFGEIAHRFGIRVEGALRGSYGIDEFSDPIFPDLVARKDDTIMTGGGIKYIFKEMLQLGFDYAEQRRTSNFSDNNYEVRTYMVSFSMVL